MVERNLLRIDALFTRLGSGITITVAALSVLGLGWLDLLTGHEMAFSIFYLIPITLVAWYSPGRACYILSLAAMGLWRFSNELAGESFSHPLITVWNALVRLVFFAGAAFLLRRLREALLREKNASRRDHLTGLVNSFAFHETLEVEYSRTIRSGSSLALAFIDLDHFKVVNDEMGHAEGDRVLACVAATLRARLRKSDTIGRIGGDEFVVLLPETDLDEGEAVASKLVTALRELSREEGWPVTASVGMIVCRNPKEERDVRSLLKQADELMYRVKDKGRDAYLVELWKPDLAPERESESLETPTAR